jgi:hypothetical protein
MPKGPKGEYRVVDPIKNALLVFKLAVGETTEAEAAKQAKLQATKRRKLKASMSKKKPSRR